MHRRAFTLIELCVVIGLTAMLVAMLCAHLSAAYRSGKGATCANNLRSIAQATMIYAHNTQWLPYSGLEISMSSIPATLELPAAVWHCALDPEPPSSYSFPLGGVVLLGQPAPRYRLSDVDAMNPVPAIYHDETPRHDGRRWVAFADTRVASVHVPVY